MPFSLFPSQHYSGLDEAVYRNISACKELAQTTRSAYGPNGMNKMVINHIEKLFVTNDAATILRELEVGCCSGVSVTSILILFTKMCL